MRFTKKLFAAALICMLAFALTPFVAFASDEITVTIDGVAVDFEDQAPIMVGGRVLIPVRFVFQDLGFEPDWSRGTRTATLTSDDYVVVIVIGEYEFTVNGESHELDVPAQLIGGRTMVPMGPILRSIGIEPGWSRSARLVTIVTPEPEVEPEPEPAELDLNLVGRWFWSVGVGHGYEFLEDGTGRRGMYPDMFSFTWSTVTEDNRLLLVFDDESYDLLVYRLEGELLNLYSLTFIYVYNYVRLEYEFIEHRVDHTGHPLVGVWVWDVDPSYMYFFFYDGSGVRGFEGDEILIFWNVVDSTLMMDVGIMTELWTFEIVDGVLTLMSLQVEDLTFSYIWLELEFGED